MFVTPSAEFLFPELEDSDVFTIFERFFAEIFVGEHTGDIEEGGFWAVEEGEESVTENVLEAGTPRFAEHTFQNADDFGRDVGFSGGVGKFERVESDGMSSVGGVEIDDVLNSGFGNEAEVVDGKIAVRVDDTIALIVKDVGEGEEFEETGFAGAGLTDDIDVAGAVAAEKSELVVDATEIGETKGGDVLVFGGVAG